MKNVTENWEYKGVKYTLTWLPDADLKTISPCTQAYGFCYTKEGKLLVVRSLELNAWQVPGGTIEPGELPEDALKREIIEEVDTEIENIIYLGAQKVEDGINPPHYQLRYAARVEKLNKRSIDPSKGIILPRRLIDPLSFRKVSKWGDIADALIRLSMEKLGIKDEI